MRLRLGTRATPVWGLALLLTLASCAKPDTSETIETSLPWPHVEPGLGSECRAQLGAASLEVEAKRFEQADQRLSTILSCFRAWMTGSGPTFISVANAAQLDRYRAEHPASQVVWIDWGYREALQLKAFMLAAQTRFDEALELLQFQVETAPYAAAPHVERGYILVTLRRHRDALGAYRHGLALAREFESSRPEEPAALRGIGFALIELGRLDEAEAAFLESLEVDPGNEAALNELRYIEHLRESQR